MKKSQLTIEKKKTQETIDEKELQKALAKKKYIETLAKNYFSAPGTIDKVKFTHYSLKELQETVTDFIKFDLENRSSIGIKSHLDYISYGLDHYVVDFSNDLLFFKYVGFSEWLREQIKFIESGGAIDYAVFLSKDQNNTKYSSFLEIIMEIEKTMELEENSLLPLIRLLKDLKVRVNNNSIKLWKIFVVIDIACSKGFILHKEYSASNDRKSKDNVVRDLLCGEVYLNGNEISSKNVSDSVRQSRKEYGSSRNTSSNYYDFSIKIEAIFDKWTFR